ncbi:hypothetical protein ACFE04_031646 [Oxalis oulophora]
MKFAGYDFVHGALGMIQPHDHLDYAAGLIQAPSNNSNVTKPSSTSVEAHCVGLERNDLSEWVEHITKQLIDDLPDSESFQADHHGNFVRPSKIARRSYFDGDQWNNEVSINHQPNVCENNERLSRVDEHGLSLMTLLLECAVAISVENLGEAHRMLLELTHMASPYGASCAERVVAYFAKAMASRVINSWLGGGFSPLIDYKTIHTAFQLFNNVSPFVKFSHFTSNQAILEAFHGRKRVHIIDLDIMQGLQWPALFHILATRPEGPPHVRMTGLGTSMNSLVETGKRLSSFAKRLGMSFEFLAIAKKIGEIDDVSIFQLRHGETLGVHWLKHSIYDANGPDWKTMTLLQELRPRVITFVEQDMFHGGSFLDRFVGSLHYYSTLFDSLGSYLPSDDPNRHRIEHCLLHKEINNILAIGGPGHGKVEKFRHWRSELAKSFILVPTSANSMAQAQLILNMFPPVYGYNLVQGDGILRLGWKDTSLFTASAWTSHA